MGVLLLLLFFQDIRRIKELKEKPLIHQTHEMYDRKKKKKRSSSLKIGLYSLSHPPVAARGGRLFFGAVHRIGLTIRSAGSRSDCC